MYIPSPQMIADEKRREGFSLSVYADSKGLPTQGYGQHAGVSFGDSPITETQAQSWLLASLQVAYDGAKSLIPGLDALDVVRKEAMIDLCFNMGLETLSEFEPLVDAVNSQNWEEAPWHLLTNTKLHLTPYLLQVGTRAIDNALRLYTGTVPLEFRA